jgi:phosphodiesterase/alkaline phosphatase D-like protein
MLKVFLPLVLAATALALCAQDEGEAAHPRITHGPVVESVTPTSAVVAWSTNVSAGSVVTYGVKNDQLTQRSEMPWGGYTHRVTLRQLQPDTTYFFQASSPDAKSSGEVLKSEVEQFRTPPANGPAAPGQGSGKI